MADWISLIERYAGTVLPLGRYAKLRRFTVSSILKEMLPSEFRATPANLFLDVLRKAGLGVRRQWLLQQFKYGATAAGKFEVQAERELDAFMRVEDMPQAPFQLHREYGYMLTMDVQGYTPDSPTVDRDVDEWGTQPYWFGSDELMSPKQVVAAFKARFKSTTMKDVRANWTTLSFVKAVQRGEKV